MAHDGTKERPDRLHDQIRQWASTRPQSEAVVAPGCRLDYAALWTAVDAYAAAMVAAGVQRGDRVATLAVPGPEFLLTFLASAAIGAIWIGLNPRYAEPELDALIARVEPRLVFSASRIEGRDYRNWATALHGDILAVDLDGVSASTDRFMPFPVFVSQGAAVARADLERRYAETRAADPCLIVFTSGSTGTPKGVLISHAALVGASRVQLRLWPAEPLRVLVNLPINHIGCVGDLCCYTLVGGGTVVFTPRFDPAASLAAIRDERVTVWGQVPTMFQLTLDAPQFDPRWLSTLQLVFWGGAHASPELVARLRELAPRLATSYGQTETVGSVTFTAPDAESTLLQETVGRVAPPYGLRIVDADGQVMAAGEIGEIQVRTPFGMSGYWRDQQASAGIATADGWQRTGDVGMLTDAGDLRLLGRVHDVFKSGGYNIYPPEIEAALGSHPGIRKASVVGVPDTLYGTVGVAFLVAADVPPLVDALREYLRGRLANYKLPKRFIFIDELPYLAVGKVDKQALQSRVAAA